MISRLSQLIRRGNLFFIPNSYPKYLKGKLRVFSISALMKTGLVGISIYLASQLKQNIFPVEVMIPYPQQFTKIESNST